MVAKERREAVKVVLSSKADKLIKIFTSLLSSNHFGSRKTIKKKARSNENNDFFGGNFLAIKYGILFSDQRNQRWGKIKIMHEQTKENKNNEDILTWK